MQNFKLDLADTSLDYKIPPGFCYINEDNYLLCRPEVPACSPNYLYSDSATSCLIVVVCGTSRQGGMLLAFAHLSAPPSFLKFFELLNQWFTGGVRLIARGGNPPDNRAAGLNRIFFSKLVKSHQPPIHPAAESAAGFFINQAELFLGEGHPLEKNRHCLGVDLRARVISSRGFALAPGERDGSGGVQTLYGMFKTMATLNTEPLPIIRQATEPFSRALITCLVDQARRVAWSDVLNLADAEIVKRFSTTPQCEPPWFAAGIRRAAELVRDW